MKQKQFVLKEIIKSCRHTQSQLVQLKKSLVFQATFSRTNKNNAVKQLKPISLLKSSKVHIQNFQRANAYSYDKEVFLKPLHRTQNNSPQQKNINQLPSIPKFNLIKNQSQQESKHQNSRKKPKQKSLHLPNISQIYSQTFKPKNASLSQHSMIERQLQNSVSAKLFKNTSKKIDKQNILKEYQEIKREHENKVQKYRMIILKQISQENVKKYLVKKNLNRQKKLMFQLKEKNFSRSYLLDK